MNSTSYDIDNINDFLNCILYGKRLSIYHIWSLPDIYIKKVREYVKLGYIEIVDDSYHIVEEHRDDFTAILKLEFLL